MFSGDERDLWNLTRDLSENTREPVREVVPMNNSDTDRDLWNMSRCHRKNNAANISVTAPPVVARPKTCVCGEMGERISCRMCDPELLDNTKNWTRVCDKFRKNFPFNEYIKVNVLTDFTKCLKHFGDIDDSKFLVFAIQTLTSPLATIIHVAEVGKRGCALNSRLAIDKVVMRLTSNKIVVIDVLMDLEQSVYMSTIFIKLLKGDLIHSIIIIINKVVAGQKVVLQSVTFHFVNAVQLLGEIHLAATSSEYGLLQAYNFLIGPVLDMLQRSHNFTDSNGCLAQKKIFTVSLKNLSSMYVYALHFKFKFNVCLYWISNNLPFFCYRTSRSSSNLSWKDDVMTKHWQEC